MKQYGIYKDGKLCFLVTGTNLKLSMEGMPNYIEKDKEIVAIVPTCHTIIEQEGNKAYLYGKG